MQWISLWGTMWQCGGFWRWMVDCGGEEAGWDGWIPFFSLIAIKKNKLKFQFFSKLKDVTPTKKNDPNDRGVGEKQKEAIRQGCEREEGKKKVFLSKKCDVWLVLYSKRQPFCRTFSFLFSSPFFSFKQPTMHKKAQKDQKKKSEGAAVAAEDHSQQQQQRKVVAAEETSEAPAAPVVQKSRIWDPIKTGFIDPLRRFSKRQAWLLCLLLFLQLQLLWFFQLFFFSFSFFFFFLSLSPPAVCLPGVEFSDGGVHGVNDLEGSWSHVQHRESHRGRFEVWRFPFSRERSSLLLQAFLWILSAHFWIYFILFLFLFLRWIWFQWKYGACLFSRRHPLPFTLRWPDSCWRHLYFQAGWTRYSYCA